MKKLIIVAIALILGYISNAQDYTTVALSDVETEVLNLVNDYRVENGLSELQISMALCYVADIHVKDLFYNKPHLNCGSLNSWSKKGNWKPLCFLKSKNAIKNMKRKPSEITNYKGQSIEIALYKDGKIAPQEVIDSWKLFPQFNNVILNLQPYASPEWKVMGIAEFNGYISLWFGPTEEKADIITIDRNSYPIRDANKKITAQQITIEPQNSVEVDNVVKSQSNNEQQPVILNNNIHRDNSNKNTTTYKDINQRTIMNDVYYVIVFSSIDPQNSNKYIDNLVKKGYTNAEMLNVDNKIRVSINHFDTYEKAENYKNKLIMTSEFKDAWILKR